MVFSSITFLLYFLPLFLWFYLLVPSSWKNATALFFSVLFYAWGAPDFVYILLASTFIDFYLVRYMFKQTDDGKKKMLLVASILLNVGLLIYFKYANFLVGNLNDFLMSHKIKKIHMNPVLLPIGISFYTFQTLTYSIDIYRGIKKPLDKVHDYLLYILLFPQMIAGPIVRFSSIADQIKKRVVNGRGFMEGMYRFSIGLAKKTLIANPMGEIADRLIDSTSDLTGPQAWLAIIAYAFQIFFDFSGYSDMAIGLGRVMGFTFPENFNAPYISKNITEFWRRWHITLGTWMRDYLYIPLGGNRKGKARGFMNLWIVFLISGFWHGAAVNFIVWGAFHGLFLILDRWFLLRITSKLPGVFNIVITFIIVLFGWVIFRIEDFSLALEFYSKMLINTWDFQSIDLSNYEWFTLLLAIIISFIPIMRLKERFEPVFDFAMPTTKSFIFKTSVTFVFLLLSLSWISTSSFNPFIYFRF